MIGVAVAIPIAVITLNFPRPRPALTGRVAKVLVLKTDHKLLLLDAANNVIHTYAIAESRGGVLAKEHQGDHRTPEGFYMVDRRKRDSRFHLALHVSYPNDTSLTEVSKSKKDSEARAAFQNHLASRKS